ncbi:hypothetical protein L195_g017840 [Trifolium pratense]|uniref:Uncharacterized protein n=1 Tax=Trifolium pratense TaxID=57577 RepID=A0A2K3MV80_TRIPR|nr:hypothetical protein L195_g017840 [Trifolium pratense]
MGQFKARYPTKEEWLIPPVNPITQIKTSSVHRFYTSNVRMRGMAFYEAYEAATESMDNKELCTNVGSMLCDVYDGFRSSVEEALYGIGVRPTMVWVPSDDHTAQGLVLVWPFILLNFACCIIMLLKNFTDEVNYKTFMINFITELKEIIGHDADLEDFPFEFKRANAIRTNLGSSARLSWSDMRHFTLINDMLVKPKSTVLFNSAITNEVENYLEACSVITSHICPRFFMYLAPKVALSKVDPMRFPTLIVVAQELERRDSTCSNVGEFELASMDGVDPEIVQDLVKLHRKLMPHNQCPA